MRYLSLILLLFLCACTGKQDPLIGRWTVEQVNVEFNEQIATPEMVRQYGELEKGNVIEIAKDSIISLISEGDTLTGRCSLKGNQLFMDGTPFGRYENGTIHTESSTPLGIIKVVYKK
jgi:hypothetical protein